jgi:hypothetical protein
MSLRDLLRRFSRKQASVDDAMRGLVSHDGWYAPMGWAAKAFDTNRFDEVCLWGSSSALPPATLWLFTDKDAGEEALQRGLVPGPVAGPLQGTRVFERVPDGLETVQVNPGSPQADGWYMGGKAIPLGRAWARAVTLEQAIDQGTEFGLALGRYPSFGVLADASAALVTAVGAAGLKNPGLIFSASDCLEAGRAKLGAAAAPFGAHVLAGPTLFGGLDRFGVDGYILNVAGVGPTRVFDREICQAIVALVEAADDAERLEAIARKTEPA